MDILDELIADHRRLCSLLNMFEHELLAYSADKAVDFQLMQDIATYLRGIFQSLSSPSGGLPVRTPA